MTLREVLTALRASTWLLLLCLVVGALVGLGASLLQTPRYTSSTELFVSTNDPASTSDVFQGSQFSQQRVASYAKLINGPELASRVIDQLHLHLSPTELRQEITATPAPETVLIDVTVTDPSPERAQQIADSIGTQFSALVEELESAGQGGGSPVKVRVTERPLVSSIASVPKTARNVVLGAFVGLLLGTAAAILRVRLDRSVKRAEDASRLGAAPVIATVLRNDRLGKQHVVDRGTTRTAEDYRQLRTNLQFLSVDKPPKVLLVSSALPSEGKTTVVVNLAMALANAGRQVVVVEADLRRPRVSEYLFGIVGDAGLTNILAATADVEDVIQTYREGLSVISAGPIPPNPGELLASTHMADVLEKLRAQNDYVLVDTPPLLPVADASALAPATDGVLLVVRYGRTRKDQLERAAAHLERVGGRTLGVILNYVRARGPEGDSYEYSYVQDGGGKYAK
jgi:receptor protein-tyrosine kinase